MMQGLPVIPEGSGEEKARLESLLEGLQCSPAGHGLLAHLATVSEIPVRLREDAKMCRARKVLGFFSENPGDVPVIVLDAGTAGEQLATLAHELGHAALSLSGFSRAGMHHPVGDMVLLKWHEALASALSAQVLWEACGEASPAWEQLRKEDPETATAFAFRARMAPASVKNGAALAAAAEALLDNDAFMAGLEAESMAGAKASAGGWAGPDVLRKSLSRSLEALPFVPPGLRGRLMMEATHVRAHPKGQVAAFLDKAGWPRDAFAEIAFPARAAGPVATSRLASVFRSVAGWLGRGDASRPSPRFRKQGRHGP